LVVIPEYSHIIRLDEISAHKGQITINVNDGERSALAKRFGLLTLDLLKAELTLRPDDKGIVLHGRIQAVLTQACTATGEAIPDEIDETVHIRFSPEPDIGAAEIELDVDDCDVQFHDGKGIDVGEAIAQTLGLALNPYPRSKQADAILRKAGVKSEEEARVEKGPFAALAALKRK
jgi:uncharacterized metal-binding protein YceD (DUF177 family)